MNGVTAERVGAHAGVDLADQDVLAQARRRRAALKLADGEDQQLARRTDFLRRKAGRLPIGNGKRAAHAETARLQTLALTLQQASDGRVAVKLDPNIARTPLEHRVIALINEIAAAGQA